MPSKEFIADIAALLADELPEGAYGFDYGDVAKKLCAGFRAALKEPTGEMCKAGRNETIGVGHFYASDIWRAMFAASALGEQSDRTEIVSGDGAVWDETAPNSQVFQRREQSE